LGGTLTNSAVAGSFTFTNLRLTGEAKQYTLTFASTGLVSAVQNITNAPGAATKVTITGSSTAANDQALAVQPVVTVRDASDNVVTGSTASITLTATGATIGGTVTMNAVNGVANFDGSGVKLTGLVGAKTITATSTPGGFTANLSVTLTFGTATKLGTTAATITTYNRRVVAQPTVMVQDVSGNTVTNATNAIGASVTSANAADVALSGASTANSVAGARTFTSFMLSGLVGNYTVTYESTGLAPVSQGVTLEWGNPVRLSLTRPASNGANDQVFSVQPELRVLDFDGNLVPSGLSVDVAVSTGSAGGSATALYSKPFTAVGGIATFSTLRLQGIADTYTLTYSAAGISSATQTITISHGAAYRLSVTAQPQSVVNRGTFTTQPVVEVQDISGNRVLSATTQIRVEPMGYTLTGTTLLNSVAGLADWSTATNPLGAYGAAGGQTLVYRATTGGILGWSHQFTLTHGVPFQVAMTSPATLVNDTVFGTQPVVTIQDQDGNTVTTGSDASQSVTLSSSNSTIGGTVTMNASAGVANFVGKGVKLTGLVGSRNLTATVSSPSEITRTNTVTITFGAANKLALTTSAAGAANDVAFTTQPVVTIQDVSGNTVTNSSASVTASAAGVTLSGTNTRAASSGVTSFANLKLTGATASYTITYSASGLTGVTQTIALGAGAATKLVLIQNALGAASRVAFATQPIVEIQDASGNRVPGRTDTITVTSSGATLGGDVTMAAVDGTATFSSNTNGLKLSGTIGTYTLTYAATGLTSATQQITLTFGAPTQLVIQTAAASARAGIDFGAQPVIRVADADGNTITSGAGSDLNIRAASSDGTLSGTTTVQANAGVATFTNLKLSNVAGSYNISYTATDAGYTSLTTTQSVILAAGTAVKLGMNVELSTGGATGSVFATQPRVAVLDAFDNIVLTDSGRTITASYSGANGGTLSGSPNLIATTSNGVATFSGLKFVGTPGTNYSLRFTVASDTLTAVNSANFTLTHAAASQIVIVQQPIGGNAVRSPLTVQPIVEIQDQYGNLVTSGSDSTRVVTVNINSDNNTGRGDLSSGQQTATAVGGRATFTNVILSDAAVNNDYTLDFTASLSGTLTTSSASSAFQVMHSAATQIAISRQASGAAAGILMTTQPIVQIRDVEGHVVSTGPASTAEVRVTVSSGGTLIGTKTVTAVAGVARFTDLNLSGLKATYTLTFEGLTLGFATVDQSLALSYGAADRLAIGTQPVGGNATGDNLATQPSIRIMDAFGNLVENSTATVAASVATGDGQGTLSGATKAAVSGVATFTALNLTATPGQAYTLQFASGALTPITSNAITLVHAPASQLVWVTQPVGGNATGDALAGQPVLNLKDRFGNLVTSDSSSVITASIASGAGGTLSNATATANAGVVAFSNLQLVGTPGTAYKLKFTVGAITSADSDAITVTNNVATQMIVSRAASGARAGLAFTTQPQVTLKDAYGNVVTVNSASGASVTATISSGGALIGNATVAATQGVATFTNLGIAAVSASYTITYAITSPVALSANESVSVTYGDAAKLTVATQPVGGKTGDNLGTQPVIRVEDAYGNLVANSSASVAATMTNPRAGDVLNGATVTAVNGVATFTALNIVTLPGSSSLTFNSSSLTAATSSNFTIAHADASQLVITSAPASGNATGERLSGQPVVEIRDRFNNLATSSTANVTVSVVSGSAGSLTSGETTVAAVGGVATFTNVRLIGLPANSYTLGFASGSLTGATSSALSVTFNTAYQIAITTQPVGGQTALALTTQPVVEIQDFYGNRVANDNSTVVTAAISSGAGGTLVGARSLTAVNGVVTFTDLALTGTPSVNYKLGFTSSPLVAANSNNFTVVAGAATQISMLTQPVGAVTGMNLGTQPSVELLDFYGNVVLSDSTTVVTVAIASGTGGTLSGNLTATAVNGVATFAGLKLTATPQANYTLRFSSGSLATTTSAALQVTHDAATSFRWITQPVGTATGEDLATQPVLELLDQYGNRTTSDNSTVVTASIRTGTNGSLAQVTATASGGVITFDSLNLVGTPGVSYTLGFAAGAIQSPASNPIVLTHAAPYRVVVLAQPVGGISGATLPANNYPILQVRDRFGNPATSDNSTQVTVAVCPQATCAGSSNGGSVTGTTTVTVVGGQVTFSDIAVAGTPGANYQLRFTSSGLMSATAAAIQLTKVADLTLSYPDTNYAPNGLVTAVMTTDSPGTVTYSTNSPSTVCTVDAASGVATIKGVGNCVVNAVVAGTTYYLTNNTVATLRILKSAQAALNLTNQNSTNFMQTLTVSSAGGSGTGAVTYNAVGTCQLVGTTLVVGDAGSSCVITATKAGDNNYEPITTAPMTVTINKIAQATLQLVNLATTEVGELELVTAGGSGPGVVAYELVSAGTANCSIVGGNLVSTVAGTCSVRATKAASTNFTASVSAPMTITVNKLNQVVRFTSMVPVFPVAQGTYDVAATATSALPVTYSITAGLNTVCKFDNVVATRVQFLTAGTCDVRATQLGDAAFRPANSTQSIVVGSLNQSIMFASISDKDFGTPAFMAMATANSGLPIDFTIGAATTNQACSIAANGLVELLAAGICEIYADQAGNNTYSAASRVSQKFSVNPVQAGAPHIFSLSGGMQSATVSFTAPSYTGGAPIAGYELVATGTDSSVLTNSACSVSGTPLSCTVIGLTPGVAYTLKVAAITSAGVGIYSAGSPIPVTAISSPTSVSNFVATMHNNDMSLSWTIPQAFDGAFVSYDIYVAPRGTEFAATPSTQLMTSAATTATLNNVTTSSVRFNRASLIRMWRASVPTPTPTSPSTLPAGFDVKIVTISTNMPSEMPQNMTSASTIQMTAPSAPTQVSTSAIGSGNLLITWSQPLNDGGSPVIDYEVKVNGTVACAATTSTNCIRLNVSDQSVNTITVNARNAFGVSAVTTATYGTNPPPPPVVTPTPTPTPTPTVTPSPTPTVKPTVRPTVRPTQTATPRPTPSATASPTASTSPTPMPTSTQALPQPSEEPTSLPPVIDPGFTVPEIVPGAPVPNPAIGATGDDNAPPAPFDPLASPEGVVALTQTMGDIAAIAGSVAAAAAAAAAGAAAAGAAAAAGGAASGSNSSGNSGSGDAGSVATVDAGHESYEDRRRGRGDRWKIWRRRWMTILDKPSLRFIDWLAKFSPLATRIVEDGAYLRAATGVFSIIPTIAAIGLGVASLAINNGLFIPPPWQLFLLIAVIGIFDTFAGLLGTTVFVIGSILMGAGTDIDSIRMLLGVVIVGYGPALLANAFRAFRKVSESGSSYWWERLVDLGVLPFIGGWVTASMISALPALAGVTLAVANHVTDFALAIALAIALRVGLEEFVARYFPERLNYLHPTEVRDTYAGSKYVALLVRLSVFIFVTAALMGNDWRVWFGSALFVLPTVIGWFVDRFPNYPWLWRILPTGVPGLAFTLVVASATTSLVGSWFGASPDLVLWSFALLPIPLLGLSILQMLGRHGEPDEVRWIQRPRFVWLYRIGGVVMLFVTMNLAGVI
jgi:hypothetical protein